MKVCGQDSGCRLIKFIILWLYIYHILTTYWPNIGLIATAHWPHIDHKLWIDHILTTYWPHIDHILTTYWPHIDHILTTYWHWQVVSALIRDNKHNFLDIYLTPENATNKDYVHKFRLEVSTRYCHTITIRYCHTITTRYCHTVTTRYCHTTLLTVPQCTLPSDAMARYRSGHFSSIPPTVPPYHSIVSLYYIPLCTVIPLNICGCSWIEVWTANKLARHHQSSSKLATICKWITGSHTANSTPIYLQPTVSCSMTNWHISSTSRPGSWRWKSCESGGVVNELHN